MGHIRIRARDPENKNKGITFVNPPKNKELLKKILIYKIILGVSVLANAILLYLKLKQ